MHDNMVRGGRFLERMPAMAKLTAVRMRARQTQRLGFGLVQAIRRWRLAGIAAVLRQPAFQVRHLGRQRADLGKQLLNQRILLADAQLGKIGKFFHAEANASRVPGT